MLTARPLPEGMTPAGEPASLSIAIRRVAQNVTVSMRGRLTAASGVAINHLLDDLIRDQGNRHLVIDVDEVTEVDRHGLEVLLQAKCLALRCGATLTVRNPPESLRKALDAHS